MPKGRREIRTSGIDPTPPKTLSIRLPLPNFGRHSADERRLRARRSLRRTGLGSTQTFTASKLTARTLDKLTTVSILAFSEAVKIDFGLIVTFIGIGVVANVLIAYAVIVGFGEREENYEQLDHEDRGPIS